MKIEYVPKSPSSGPNSAPGYNLAYRVTSTTQTTKQITVAIHSSNYKTFLRMKSFINLIQSVSITNVENQKELFPFGFISRGWS